MNALDRRSLVLALALSFTASASAQSPPGNSPNRPTPGANPAVGTSKPALYDCFGLEGVALRNCAALNSAAANPVGSNPSASHDCSGMTGAALATCRDLNGEPPVRGNLGYGPADNSVPNAYGTNANTGYGNATAPNGGAMSNTYPAAAGAAGATGSSSGSNPTDLSGGSGRSPPSAGTNPTAPASGSGIGAGSTPKTPTSR